jgi:hypothetical protein
MPGYITNVLNKFQHDAPRTPHHTPSKYITPVYGANVQFSTQDNSPHLTAKQCTEIQKITGSFLYYSGAVDPTVLITLNDIATEQTTDTEKTKTAAGQLLDYLAAHPDDKIRFQASDMILQIHSDASYLSISKERSILGGLFYLGYNPPNQDKFNGSVLNFTSVIKNAVASAVESEFGACFQNAQTAPPSRTTLLEIGHTQPATPLRTNSSTEYGILNKTITQKHSKSMDMKYYWLQNRVRKKQFDFYWRPGTDNMGDNHTKHHPAQHYQDMRPILLHQASILNVLRGCAKLPQPKLRQPPYAQTFQCTKLPQPKLHQPTDVQTSQRTLRDTQVRCALARAYAKLLQNRPLWRL